MKTKPKTKRAEWIKYCLCSDVHPINFCETPRWALASFPLKTFKLPNKKG